MIIPPYQIALMVLGAAAVLAGLVYLDRVVPEGRRPFYRIAAAILGTGGFFYGVQRLIPDFAISVDIIKGVLGGVAAACVFYEAHRISTKRPIAEKWKKFVGVVLAVAAVLAYYNGFRNGYDKAYHRHELFHYYLGAKYFPELGYDHLYKCTVIAQDDLGVYKFTNEDTGRPLQIDMKKEANNPDRKVRNLGDDNLLVSAQRFLEHPEICKDLFTPAHGSSPERWEAFKKDVAFFRSVADREYFNKMQLDHGFNPPPVWTLAGKFFADLHVATTPYMQTLASIDLFFIGGMLVALWWAFGWRVAVVGAVFWGCQSPAPMLWTAGAFLRQDWLFFTVLSVCLLKKKHPMLSAAAIVYAALLRIFPGILVVGWLGVVGWQLYKHHRLTKQQLQMLAGGVLCAAVLIPASIKVCGVDSYKEFYTHTLKVHDQTPLTNHMGLRVLIAQKLPFELPSLGLGIGPDSGRMKYTEDNKLSDAFSKWKQMRNDRYAKFKIVGYALSALTLVFFLYVARRMKNMWLALCAAQVFVIMLSQLTCYYYSYMILSAPLTRVKPLRKFYELSLFGFVVVSQFAFQTFRYNDDKYWVLTLLCLALNLSQMVALAPASLWVQIQDKLPFLKPRTPQPAPQT